MLNLKRILCPIDLNYVAKYALDYACDIARQNGATVYLLNVARTPAADMDTPVAIEANPYWEQVAERRLEQIAREQIAADLPFRIIIRGGIPQSVILRTAAELKIDLIVMSTHGRTGLAHFLLGSLAETTAEEAPCPVLVVPEPAASRADDSKK
jgi:universal stress protein A